jgi:hypothetical protein
LGWEGVHGVAAATMHAVRPASNEPNRHVLLQRAPLGGSLSAQGLRTNDTYLFAVALYDEDGQLVSAVLV